MINIQETINKIELINKLIQTMHGNVIASSNGTIEAKEKHKITHDLIFFNTILKNRIEELLTIKKNGTAMTIVNLLGIQIQKITKYAEKISRNTEEIKRDLSELNKLYTDINENNTKILSLLKELNSELSKAAA